MPQPLDLPGPSQVLHQAGHAAGRVALLVGVTALASLPVATWLTAAAALSHSLQRWREGDPAVLHTFVQGWRRDWRRTLPAGVVSALVAVALVAELTFLLAQRSPSAVLLAAGTLTLCVVWAAGHLLLVPVLVLEPQLRIRRAVVLALALAFRRPPTTLAVVTGHVVAIGSLAQAHPLLMVLWTPVVAFSGLLLCERGLETAAHRGVTRPAPVTLPHD